MVNILTNPGCWITLIIALIGYIVYLFFYIHAPYSNRHRLVKRAVINMLNNSQSENLNLDTILTEVKEKITDATQREVANALANLERSWLLPKEMTGTLTSEVNNGVRTYYFIPILPN